MEGLLPIYKKRSIWSVIKQGVPVGLLACPRRYHMNHTAGGLPLVECILCAIFSPRSHILPSPMSPVTTVVLRWCGKHLELTTGLETWANNQLPSLRHRQFLGIYWYVPIWLVVCINWCKKFWKFYIKKICWFCLTLWFPYFLIKEHFLLFSLIRLYKG